MNKGAKDYLVQVTIIEARGLSSPDGDGIANPFVKLTCGKLPPQSTIVKKETLDPNWNQSFTFDNVHLTDQDLQTTELSVEVYSKNKFFVNDLIGMYSIGLSTLYKSPGHEFYNRWMVLINQEVDADEAQGYLLIDAFIIGPGDRPPVHDRNEKVNQDVEEENEDINIDEMTFEQLRAYQEKKQSYQLIGKPTVARKGFQLSCYIFRAESLPEFDKGKTKPSAFVSCRVAGLVRKTKSVKKKLSPLYNQKMLFPCYFPFLNDKILLRIWSDHSGSKDVFIANIPEFQKTNDYFNLSKLVSIGGRMPAKWVNLYGIPIEERNSFLINKVKHPEEGTAFMGRVFLSFSLVPNEEPRCSTEKTNPFYEQESDSYTLFSDIYELSYLRDDVCDIAVWCQCSIGAYQTEVTFKKMPDKGAVKWLEENKKGVNEITLPAVTNIYYPKDYEQVPDIFVNLYTGTGEKNDKGKRIGYIRLKAELVNSWTADATPRWLHFQPLDRNKPSPGSILINLQFMSSTDSTKRIFKSAGIQKKFQLFAHIVNGFELLPKVADDEKVEFITKIKVKLSTKEGETEEKKGRYPFFNQIISFDAELDWKLDFTPDVMVSCFKKTKKNAFSSQFIDEEVGRFTVPVVYIKQLKKYPHYFNLISKGEIVGRVMALFYIVDYQSKDKAKEKFGEIYRCLEKERKANVKVFLLGARNLNYKVDKSEFQYQIDMTVNGEVYQSEEEKLKEKKKNHNLIGEGGDAGGEGRAGEAPEKEEENKKNKKELNVEQEINEEESCYYVNIIKCFEYKDIPIRGDKEFQIYPYIKILLSQKRFFVVPDRKFIVFNLEDFIYGEGLKENKKKMYRTLFNQNLGVTSLSQEQVVFKKEDIKNDLVSMEDGGKEMGSYHGNEDNYDVYALIKRREIKKEKQEEEEKTDSIRIYDSSTGREDRKRARLIKNYNNVMLGEHFGLECKPKDKAKEKEFMKQLRKDYYRQLTALRRLPSPTMEQRNQLMDLEQKFRDAKKPQMSEPMFFGFEDISDEYNYGREVYKEGQYETNPNFIIPYKHENLCSIPNVSLVTDAYETMEGYYKLGKKTDVILKYNVKVEFNDKDEEKERKSARSTYMSERDTKMMKTKGLFDENKEKEIQESYKLEKELDKEAEQYDVFNETYRRKLRFLYLSKNEQNKNKEDNLKLPLNGLRVRVYIYRCINLAAQDNYFGLYDNVSGFTALSTANAYLEIQIGDEKDTKDDKGLKFVSTEDDVVPNTLSPNFYKCYEMESDLPKDWKLTINVMTKKNGKDNLIGRTVIDLEDRYLGEFRTRSLMKYKSLEFNVQKELAQEEKLEEDKRDEEKINLLNKKLDLLDNKINKFEESQIPVEFRELYKPDTKTAQGVIEMFVEILPQKRAKIKKMAPIEEPPPQDFEIRLVIWETRELAYEGRKTIDAFISVTYDPEGYLKDPINKQTDVHLGCENGRAKFNWRMKFDLTVPCTFPRLRFELRDFSTFSADEALSYCIISIKRLIKKLLKEGKLELKNKWIPLGNRDDPGEVKGEIKIDLYILPKFEADQNKVGEAQDEPNHSPKLIRPKEGRGISDFLKGTFLDFSGWKWNFSLFGALKVLIAVAIVVILLVILFVQPGILVK